MESVKESLKGRDLLSVSDLSVEEARYLLDLAAQMKLGEVSYHCPKVLGLLFQKASTRTRVSFTVAMYQLGGQVIDLNPQSSQVSRGEPLEDTARVLDRYLDVLAIRTFQQSDLQTIAHLARIPVINALTDQEHPCQILADLLTIKESFGSLDGLTLTYVGDGNNVAHSLLLGCALLGVGVRVATPPGYGPDPAVVQQAQELGMGTEIVVTEDPKAATEGAHVVYTDVWASMGQEAEAEERQQSFVPYQLNESLMGLADPDAIVLHCLPAHRGEEITDVVMEGPQSRIWEQAENRMHVQKALLASILC
jgi:ornithine carbamoyltransferase